MYKDIYIYIHPEVDRYISHVPYKVVPPSFVCWFINHSKYRYIYNKP